MRLIALAVRASSVPTFAHARAVALSCFAIAVRVLRSCPCRAVVRMSQVPSVVARDRHATSGAGYGTPLTYGPLPPGTLTPMLHPIATSSRTSTLTLVSALVLIAITLVRFDQSRTTTPSAPPHTHLGQPPYTPAWPAHTSRCHRHAMPPHGATHTHVAEPEDCLEFGHIMR